MYKLIPISRRSRKTTNLFHSPRRVKTDSILDLWRFQRKPVWHVHTQHCHHLETFPSVIISWLFCVSAAVEELLAVLNWKQSVSSQSGSRLNLSVGPACRKAKQRPDWSKVPQPGGYLSALLHAAACVSPGLRRRGCCFLAQAAGLYTQLQWWPVSVAWWLPKKQLKTGKVRGWKKERKKKLSKSLVSRVGWQLVTLKKKLYLLLSEKICF